MITHEKKTHRLLWIIIVFFFSSSTFSCFSPRPNHQEERIINFPADRSMGTLYVIEENPHFLSGAGEVEKGEAKGRVRVTVPEGWLLELRVNSYASTDISPLSTLKPNDLQSISFYQTQVTDEQLVQIKPLYGLKILDLSNTKITGLGLRFLQEMPKLEMLNLTLTQVTDVKLAYLKQLHSLHSLNISKTKIGDIGLSSIKDLPALEELNLYYTNVSDAGLQQLQGLNQLQFLDIGWTKVSDTGLIYLKGLSMLLKLVLDSTNITDAGLQQLQGLKKLQSISLNDTEITEVGVKKLSQHLPPCSIETNVIDRRKLFPSCFAN